MDAKTRWCALFLFAFFVCPDPTWAFLRRHQDNEQDLQAHIQREANPIKKAKLEIRLGRLKLIQSMAALDQGNIEEANRLLGVYVETLNDAWQRLKNSGQMAHKNSSGFKELDIELREDGRYLEDLSERVPYNQRDTAKKVVGRVNGLRNEVLQALFPPIPLGKDGNKSNQ